MDKNIDECKVIDSMKKSKFNIKKDLGGTEIVFDIESSPVAIYYFLIALMYELSDMSEEHQIAVCRAIVKFSKELLKGETNE